MGSSALRSFYAAGIGARWFPEQEWIPARWKLKPYVGLGVSYFIESAIASYAGGVSNTINYGIQFTESNLQLGVDINPEIGFVYEINPRWSVGLTYSQIFLSGQGNSLGLYVSWFKI